ncbi:MAG: hypothetical protein ACJAQT_001925 [Akkermansiaceae bacterium]
MNVGVAEGIAALEVGEFDEKGHANDIGIEGFEQLDGGGSGASGGEEIVHEEDFLARFYGVGVDFDDVFAVFETISHLVSGPRELSFFTNGNEARVEVLSDSSGKDETAGIDPDDFVDLGVTGGGGEECDGGLKERGIPEDGRDVFEKDSRFREIGDIANRGVKVGGIGHERSLNRNAERETPLGRFSMNEKTEIQSFR